MQWWVFASNIATATDACSGHLSMTKRIVSFFISNTYNKNYVLSLKNREYFYFRLWKMKILLTSADPSKFFVWIFQFRIQSHL